MSWTYRKTSWRLYSLLLSLLPLLATLHACLAGWRKGGCRLRYSAPLQGRSGRRRTLVPWRLQMASLPPLPWMVELAAAVTTSAGLGRAVSRCCLHPPLTTPARTFTISSLSPLHALLLFPHHPLLHHRTPPL